MDETLVPLLLLFLATTVITMLAALIVVIRLPVDHFTDPFDRRRSAPRHPIVRVVLLTVRNLAGWLLIAVGLVLSLPGVPGQGLLTIFIGVLLIDLPGKHRLERWLMSRRGVLPVVTRLRTCFGRPPFELP